jgi:hypothetical protein
MDTFLVVVLLAILIGAPLHLYYSRNPAMVLVWVVGVTAFLYVYGGYWRHPEGFSTTDTASSKEIPVMQDLNKPYATGSSIMSVDDYEYNLVFKSEGDRAMTKKTRDLLMSKYPMDWSVQPPSSELFQQGLAAYKEQFTNPLPPPKGNPYKEIDGSQMVPPDMKAVEMQEREILATYVPKDPKSLTTYDAADAKELIDKIYGAKGLVADVRPSGPNQFTIVGTSKKDAPVVWEDDGTGATAANASPASSGPVQAAGEGTIVVPPVAAEVQQGLDPFFTPGPRSRDQPWDYTRWTPGLERMFAPTEPQTNWY